MLDAYALPSSVYLSQGKYDNTLPLAMNRFLLVPMGWKSTSLWQLPSKIHNMVNQSLRWVSSLCTWILTAYLGIGYRLWGSFEESAATLKKRFDITKKVIKSNMRIYLCPATAYSMMGRMDWARAGIAKALEFNPKITIQ